MKVENLADLLKLGKVHIDYMTSKECVNPESYFAVCVKCGQCGRKFDENGIMIDDGGTSVDESDFDY